jgi:hypothetical protein
MVDLAGSICRGQRGEGGDFAAGVLQTTARSLAGDGGAGREGALGGHVHGGRPPHVR